MKYFVTAKRWVMENVSMTVEASTQAEANVIGHEACMSLDPNGLPRVKDFEGEVDSTRKPKVSAVKSKPEPTP